MGPLIVETQVSGHEITRIINTKIAPAIEGEDSYKVVLSLLSFAMILMKPEITAEQLQEGVTWVSQGMCLFLAEPEAEDGMGPGKMVAN
jgi:hypothetical protein